MNEIRDFLVLNALRQSEENHNRWAVDLDLPVHACSTPYGNQRKITGWQRLQEPRRPVLNALRQSEENHAWRT